MIYEDALRQWVYKTHGRTGRDIPQPQVIEGKLVEKLIFTPSNGTRIYNHPLPEKSKLKEGKKTLTGKPEWCIVPMEAMVGVVRVFEAGAKTYGGGSTWLPGIKFSRLFSAIVRHLFDWFYFGKNKDNESGQHPLCHVIANCLMLLTFIDSKRFDDRQVKHQCRDGLMYKGLMYKGTKIWPVC